MKTISSTLLAVLIGSFVFASPDQKQLELTVTAPNFYFDKTVVYFDLGIASVFNNPEDVQKIFSTISNTPSIYTLSSDNVALFSNGFSNLISTEMISVGIKSTVAGDYLIKVSNLGDFDQTTIIRLEDKETNVFTNLRSGSYTVSLPLNAQISGRFVLHVSRPVQFSSVPADCSNTAGAILVNQDNSLIWTSAILFDTADNAMGNFANISGAYSFNDLAEGDYTLVLNFENYVVNKTLHVDGIQIRMEIQPSSATALVNSEITFNTVCNNVSTYEWDMGDGTLITGVANPAYSYYLPGVYQIVLNCTNAAGCVNSDSTTVTIGTMTDIKTVGDNQIKITSDSKTIRVVISEEVKQDGTISIYNLIGQPISSQPVTELTTSIAMNQVPAGYYIVSVENNNKTFTNRVFIGQ